MTQTNIPFFIRVNHLHFISVFLLVPGTVQVRHINRIAADVLIGTVP